MTQDSRNGRRLLEREHELAQLRTPLDDAADGRGRPIVIEAAAGLGKTRLMEAVGPEADARGMRVLSARGSPLEQEFAFGVVRQLYEPAVEELPSKRREEAFAGAAGLARPLLEGGPAVPAGADPTYPVLHGLYWVTQNLAGEAPLVLAVDDAHWADQSSLRFLLFLLARVEDIPVALIVSVRSGEPATEEGLAAQLAAAPGATTLRPGPLSVEAGAVLIEDALGAAPEPEFAGACHEAVAGNPFLTEVLCRELHANGIAPDAQNAANVSALGPRAVSRSLLLRLAAMEESAGAFVRSLAVLGDGSELAHVAALAGLNEEEAAHAADLLARMSILKRSSELQFLHPIVREAIYADLGPRERSARHALAAHVLREAGAQPERIAAQLQHTDPAGDSETVAILRGAARLALSRGSVNAAIAHLERALAEPPSAAERGSVLLELGVAGGLAARPEAVGHLRAAISAAGGPEDASTRALALGEALFLNGEMDQAYEVAREAADRLGDLDDETSLELEVLVLTAALATGRTGETAERERALERRLAGRSVAVSPVFGPIASRKLISAEPRAEVIAGVERALVEGQLDLASIDRPGRDYPALLLVWLDELDWAEKLHDRAIDRAQQMGSQPAFARLSAGRAYALHRHGELQRAATDLEAALAPPDGSALLIYARLIALLTQTYLLVDKGEPAAAEQLVAATQAPPLSERLIVVSTLHHGLGLAQLAQQRFEDAATTLKAAGEAFKDGGYASPTIASWRSDLALALGATGKRDEALTLAEEELALAERADVDGARGVALRALGLLHGSKEGVERLEQAVAALERSPRRLEHARALCDLGAALRRANKRRDARERLQAARELAVACGGLAVAERAATELSAIGARPRRELVTRRDELTPSELRAAEMAADGMSNAEIAQALFVSLKTIETHLSACYRKLDIASRAELTHALSQPERAS